MPTLVSAGSPGLPESARPGALRPGEDRPTAPPKPAEEVLEVPALIDRPLDIDEGPKVVVEKFELAGAVERPEHDVRLSEIKTILEEQRQQRPEGFTIGRLDEVADAVTQYYRERGLILAQAVVPVQTVEDGVVKVEVIEGRLGRILTEGNAMYDADLLREPFEDLIGKPVTKAEVEAALLTLTDFPGLSIFGVFQPGQKVGEADIVLKVQEEDRFDFSLRVDNHGTPETGRRRARPSVEWNNPTGAADRLTLTGQVTHDPQNSKFFSIDYERYFGNGFRGGTFITRNSFDVGGEFADREISATTEQQGLYLDKTLIRSRALNLSTRLGVTLKDSRTTQALRQTNEDHLTVLSWETTYDAVDTRFSGLNFGTLELSHGFNDTFGAMGSSFDASQRQPGDRPSRQGGPPDSEFASGRFNKVFGTFSRLQTVTQQTSLLLRAEAQWSPDLLVPLEQYSIGGPDNVRAFGPAEALFDKAIFLSAEYIINAPFFADKPAFANRTWGELLQFSVFYDFATGENNEPLTNEPQGLQDFHGAGWGLRFNLPGSVESRFLMAWDFGDTDPDNDRDPQIWADVTFRF
ncbi:MAG: ShlB/FhaC/HecB family hemolysin secretion/activation protein [Gammaproteobacteria bacterium]|nr:ShlB/FhaC/HecB family hemolysin secretion/activation protein [Gammaproteobacteria bacterium]